LNAIYRVIEILVLIIFPLLVLYLRSNWTNKEIYVNVIVLPLIWYLFYAPIHELSHMLGCIIVGADITDYRLFAHFWEGSFGFAYVDVKGGLGVNMNSLIILISPYILDFISIIVGYYILTRFKIINSLLFGLTFLIFCLRPLYDIADNYIGIFYNHSDLVLTSQIIGKLITYSYGFITMIIGIIVAFVILNKYKSYPILEYTMQIKEQ
jgi:hypothetical protein